MAKRKKETEEEQEARWAREEEEERQEKLINQQVLDDLFAKNADVVNDSDYPNCGYVYFLECDDHIKIGKGKDVRVRIKDMQTGNPNPIELRDAIFCEDMHIVERLLHLFFEDHKKNGEWHHVGSEDVAKVAKEFREWAERIADTIENIFGNYTKQE